MLSQIVNQKIFQDNLRSLNAKRAFLNDREAFGQYLQSSSDFRNFCSNHQPQLFGDSVVVRDAQEIESFANLVYQYTLQITGTIRNPHNLIVYAKSYSSFTKGDPSYVFEDDLKLRSLREAAALNEFTELKISQLSIPSVILCDSERELLITLGLENGGKAIRLNPTTDSDCEYLCLVCSVLAKVHCQTYSPILMVHHNTHAMASTLFFRGTLARQLAEKNVGFAISWQTFIEDTLSRSFCRLHGNLTPRNIIMLGDSRLAFFDFEFSMYGDPAFDIGTLLGHYILEMIVHPTTTFEIQANLLSAWDAYSKNLYFYSKVELGELEVRAIKYIALTLLYRSWFESSSRLESVSVKDKLAKFAVYIFSQEQLLSVLDSVYQRL